MFNKLAKVIEKNIDFDFTKEFIERLAIIRFGSMEEAENVAKSLNNTNKWTDESFNEFLKLLYLDKFKEIFEPIVFANGYIELFKKLAGLTNKINSVLTNMDNQELEVLNKYLNEIRKDKYFEKAAKKGIFGKKRYSLQILGKLKVTTKDEISKEIGIDKETLNKWLENSFGKKKFFNTRKINLLDYLIIMLKFSTAEHEKKGFMNDDINAYADRLTNDLVHNRADLLNDERLDDLNYKSLKENLKLQKLDKNNKKIPYSEKEKIASRLS